MMWLAHSARRGRPAQLYSRHVQGVVGRAEANVRDLLEFSTASNRDAYVDIVKQAACYHDLGKLSEPNQMVFRGEKESKNLPVEHRDAGIQYLLGSKRESPDATLIYAHHWPGLPNLLQETLSEDSFRFPKAMKDTGQFLPEYVATHKQLTGDLQIDGRDFQTRLSSLEYRMLLSCLVDADHSDTAGVDLVAPAPRWGERLSQLDSYVASLGKDTTDFESKRNELRSQVYECCRNLPVNDDLEYCDSPVGTGKTTAVMARALKVAKQKGYRHIFVVLPYTNIISQTVDVLRKTVVLEGEDASAIVAEHHHQADFESVEYRHMATTWTAPIIVTTAVQFFETLASNHPARLRKLHQLPGSCVIIDESHAALPIGLMPVAWKWQTDLATNWGCYVCFCSGTSLRFWENAEFSKAKEVSPIITTGLADKLGSSEQGRLTLNAIGGKVPYFRGVSALIGYLQQFRGPRLVVLNTVRNAAYLAKVLQTKGKDVLHLSTALSPTDRERVIAEVTNRLGSDSLGSQDWTLVATSCVECGMDFSFRNGFCELRSVQSYLQLAGRINRNGEYRDSTLNCLTIVDDNFRSNPSFKIAQGVFEKLIELEALRCGSITDLVTESFSAELKQMGGLFESISKAERRRNLADVAEQFRVISEDTVTVLVDPDLIQKLQSGTMISSKELQRGSVNMRRSLLKELSVITESELPYLTADGYDDFLGYMKNV